MTGPKMPEPDRATLEARARIVADLQAIVPGEGVVDATEEMRAFETDGLTAYRQLPLVVVGAMQPNEQRIGIIRFVVQRSKNGVGSAAAFGRGSLSRFVRTAWLAERGSKLNAIHFRVGHSLAGGSSRSRRQSRTAMSANKFAGL